MQHPVDKYSLDEDKHGVSLKRILNQRKIFNIGVQNDILYTHSIHTYSFFLLVFLNEITLKQGQIGHRNGSEGLYKHNSKLKKIPLKLVYKMTFHILIILMHTHILLFCKRNCYFIE